MKICQVSLKYYRQFYHQTPDDSHKKEDQMEWKLENDDLNSESCHKNTSSEHQETSKHRTTLYSGHIGCFKHDQ